MASLLLLLALQGEVILGEFDELRELLMVKEKLLWREGPAVR